MQDSPAEDPVTCQGSEAPAKRKRNKRNARRRRRRKQSDRQQAAAQAQEAVAATEAAAGGAVAAATEAAAGLHAGNAAASWMQLVYGEGSPDDCSSDGGEDTESDSESEGEGEAQRPTKPAPQRRAGRGPQPLPLMPDEKLLLIAEHELKLRPGRYLKAGQAAGGGQGPDEHMEEEGEEEEGEGPLRSQEDRYAKYQVEAAEWIKQIAQAAFIEAANGDRQPPTLPPSLRLKHVGGKLKRRSLQYAAQLRQKNAMFDEVECYAGKYARHAQRLCLQFEALCLGAEQVLGVKTPSPKQAPRGSSGGDSGDSGGSGGSGKGRTTRRQAAGSSAKGGGGSKPPPSPPPPPPTSHDTYQYLKPYLRLMFELFPELTYRPVMLPTTVLEAPEGSALALAVQRLRDLCKRFVVFVEPGAMEEAVRAAAAVLDSGLEVPVESLAMQEARRAQLEHQQQQQQEAEVATAAAAAAAAAAAGTTERKRGGGGVNGGTGNKECSSKRRKGEGGRMPRYMAYRDELRRTCVLVEEEGSEPRAAGGRWGEGLLEVNDTLLQALAQPKLQYRDVTFDKDLQQGQLSCNLLFSHAQSGMVVKNTPGGGALIANAVKRAQDPGDTYCNLYCTDGTKLVYTDDYPDNAPGLCCAIDNTTNAMLPAALRTHRGTNANNIMKSESSGVATATGYAMLGCRPACTAAHQETLLLPSINLGSGDLVVQLLTACNNVRRLHRLHAAVAGEFRRHGSLLPPHMYLLDDIPLVLHLRDEGYPSVVEFPQASCHAVITYGSQQCYPPTTKVAFNDIEIRSQVAPAYLSNLLATAYTGLVAPEGHPEDKANQWMQSCYLLPQPCTQAEKEAQLQARTFPPWREEYDEEEEEGEEEEGEGDGGGEAGEEQDDDGNGDEGVASMDLLLVRLTERLLDGACGRIMRGRSWSRGVPTPTQCLQALADLLPTLRHLLTRAVKEEEGEEPQAFLSRLPPGAAPVSTQYLQQLLAAVEQLGPQGLHEQLECGRFAGMPLRGLPACSGHGSKQTAAQFAGVAASSAWVLDAYLCCSNAVRGQLMATVRSLSDEQLLRLGADVVRGHWLLACHLEWKQVCRQPVNWEVLTRARQQRARMERLCGQASDALVARVLAGAGS